MNSFKSFELVLANELGSFKACKTFDCALVGPRSLARSCTCVSECRYHARRIPAAPVVHC